MQKNSFPFPVEVVEDVFGESPVLADTLKHVCGIESPRVFLVADLNVVQRTEGLGTKIGRYLQAHGLELAATPAVLSAGEKIKADSLQSVRILAASFLKARLRPTDCILIVGGGSLFDVAGYAAAQIRGKPKVIRMPTTVAAFIDAAFADSAAVDSIQVKDALRIPQAPDAVIIDFTFAKTVLDGVWRAGFGEILRLAIVADSALFKKAVSSAEAFSARDYETMKSLVTMALSTRRKKGRPPFAEWSTVRLEPMSTYKLPHGYAVVISICVDLAYAVIRGHVKPEVLETVFTSFQVSGALDGAVHSQHLINRFDDILIGLEDHLVLEGHDGIVLPAGIGKQTIEENPDREIYRQALGQISARISQRNATAQQPAEQPPREQPT